MLETQKNGSERPTGEASSDTKNTEESSQDDRKKPPKDPTRYGDWEVGGRCIDF